MAASRDDIRHWLQAAQLQGATHMLVVCDTFNHLDYPVPVMPGQNSVDEYERITRNPMLRVMEVYDLALDWDRQLDEVRALHFGPTRSSA